MQNLLMTIINGEQIQLMLLVKQQQLSSNYVSFVATQK